MNLADLLDEDHVIFDLAAKSKKELFHSMTRRLAELGAVADAEGTVGLLLKREDVMSTGVGNGVGVPHAFPPDLDHSLLSIGFIPDGLDYQSLDNRPVHTVFLLLGTPATQGQHLRTLARLSRVIGTAGLVEQLRGMTTGHDVTARIRAEEERLWSGQTR
jgi:mannitol/fructose-specific phosphotransferase system IIA component (Ntr-type)